MIERLSQLTGGDGSDGDLLSFRVTSRITLRSKYDRDGRTWFCLDVHGVQSVLSASLMIVRDEVHVKERRYYEHTKATSARSVSSLRRSIRASVSGSPNLTLYSKTLGPSSVIMKPVNRIPTNGKPI